MAGGGRVRHALGTESALARADNASSSERPHHAYLFASRRANRMKVLVHDGVGIWLAARRLHSGKFAWPKDATGTMTLTREQLNALVLGLLCIATTGTARFSMDDLRS